MSQKRKPKPGDSVRCGRAAPYDGPDYLEIAPSWRAMLEDSCPFSFYRISVDVAPQFESTVHNLNRAYLLIQSKPIFETDMDSIEEAVAVLVTLKRTNDSSD